LLETFLRAKKDIAHLKDIFKSLRLGKIYNDLKIENLDEYVHAAVNSNNVEALRKPLWKDCLISKRTLTWNPGWKKLGGKLHRLAEN